MIEPTVPASEAAPADAARTPLVSIVLPTYNGARYLHEAIDSVRGQSYENWELIVVDDCSTDSTPEIIASYVASDRRIRSIRNHHNQKLPASLNTGHAAASGNYLTWTSDDNRFLAPALEHMTHFLEEHPEVGVVYADCVLIDEAGRYLGEYSALPASRLAYMNALRACFLYRRRVYETLGGYDAELFLAEDYEFWLRASREFELAPLHKVLYEYRWHDQSLTSSVKRSAVRQSIERALRRHLPHLRHSSPEDLARGWTVCAANAARRGDWAQAAGAYLRALRTDAGSSLSYVARKVVDRVRHHGVGLQPEP